LRDVVFSLKENEQPKDCFDRFTASFNEQVRPNAIGHIKTEYSTYDWIMEGLIKMAGFRIISKTNPFESFFVYHCIRIGDK
jgi:hypothetical protein